MESDGLEDCIKCKIGYYQDEPGQKGCKRCGATSTSRGGDTYCQCIGLGRNFIKSIGACLCSKGYVPLNDAPNVDSGDDCEADIKPVCGPGELITVDGECLKSADDENLYCNDFCATGGSVIPGTGMCSCND